MLLINKVVSLVSQDTSSYIAPQNVSLALHFKNNYNYLDNSPKTYFLEKAFRKARAPRRGIPVSKTWRLQK